jgi:subtilisin family serine protease
MVDRSSSRWLGALFLLATSAASTLAVAQQPVPPEGYTAIPGERELSGFVIARPLQQLEAAGKGITGEEFQTLRSRAQTALNAIGVERQFPEVDEFILRVPAGETETTLARRMLASGAFAYVEPDWILYPINNCTNDPGLPSQWHHADNRLNTCAAWTLATGSPAVVVGICDTGVRVTHQDLLAHRVEGYHVPSQTWESNGGPISDINGHGTLCTGSAAANGNNGVGVAGLGWNLGHRMLRVTDSGTGSASLSNLTLAARRAAEFGDRVASVSYSGVNSSSVFTAGTYVRSLGSLLVWAAGNSNVSLSGNREDDVIVVGATTQSDTRASFSNYGPLVDLVAPGVSILTTHRNSDTSYAYADGTSFAAPIVAGLCALIWSRNPDLSPDEVESILRTTCVDLGSSGLDNTFGYGRIEAGAALAATPPSGPDTTPPPAPTGLTATGGNMRVDLVWDASPAPDLAGYDIFRSVNGGGFALLNSALLTSSSYADLSVVNGTNYAYYVTAEDLSGNVSERSATISAVPSAASPELFVDGFESGNLTAGGWLRENTDAFADTSAAYAGSWGARLRRTTWIERSISTAGVQDIEVSYVRRTAGLTSSQSLVAEWSNGTTWTQLEATRATSFQAVSFALPSEADNNSQFRLRFRLNGNNPNRRADIDDVEVSGTPIP